MITYPIPGSSQHVLFGRQTLAEFARWKQERPWSLEAGGQLFARDEGQAIQIAVTGPRPADRRRRFSFIPDREAERAEIARMHLYGMHFVGDWHTHPQDAPLPSWRDVESMSDLFARSGHRLNAMLLVIVGRIAPPKGLYVGLHYGSQLVRLVHDDAGYGAPRACEVPGAYADRSPCVISRSFPAHADG